MTLTSALILAVLILVAWIAWGSVLFPRVYPRTHDELLRKIERGTLTPDENREALRVILLLPLVLLIRWLTLPAGRSLSCRATNFVALRLFKLPQ